MEELTERIEVEKTLDPLLTVQQVALWLNMSPVWVYKAAEKGLLPFHRVGEAIRFDPHEIRTYLDARRDIKKKYSEPRNRRKKKKANALLLDHQEARKSN